MQSYKHLKKTLSLVFSIELGEVFQDNFFLEHFWGTSFNHLYINYLAVTFIHK